MAHPPHPESEGGRDRGPEPQHRHDRAHRHGHHHGHHHGPGHVGRLDPQVIHRRDVFRIGRRQFVADLGRRTFAVAILGTGIAACSSDDDGAGSASSGATASPTASATAAAPTATDVPAPEPTANDASDAAAEEQPSTDTAATLRWSQVVLGNVSAYVLVRGNEAAVVDTGNPGSADEIGAALATMGLNYADVGHVVLTHRHPDHIGSLDDVLVEATSATAYAGAEDIENIQSSATLQAIGDGDSVFGLDVINTPGHTPGSISVFDTEIGLLVAGDALNGNGDGTEITGPNERFSTDLPLGAESVRKLAALNPDIAAFGHGNPVDGGAAALLTDLAGSL